MNYGKSNASKKQQNISSKDNMKKKRVGVRLFKALVVCVLIAIVLCGVGGVLFVKKILADTPTVSPADVRPSGYTTFVYAEDGTELERFVSSGSNRIYKNISEIPTDLAHAFVAIEDERFYTHNGIDLQGIMRAAVVGVTSGNLSEGASTLTQQLIKNNVFPNFTEEKTIYDKIERKLQEQFLAVEIEKQMSKDEIIEAYMNTINLGSNCLGVQSAAQRYFGKDVSELTLSECAVIAGITQNPSRYNPVNNPEENAKRRQKVLGNMLTQGYITQEQYDEAIADDVYSRIQTANVAATSDDSPYSYFVDELATEVIQDLQDKLGYTYTQAYNAVYSGGLSITATQDLNIQQICDEEMNNDENYPDFVEYGLDYRATWVTQDGTVTNYSTQMLENYLRQTRGDSYPLVFDSPESAQAAVDEYKSTWGVQEGDTIDEKISISPQPQASVVIMDQKTGHVKAIVGGRGEKESSLSLDRATDSYRQPGSCFKVLSTYAPAIDAFGYTLATTIEDEPFTYTDGTQVKNWWGESYRGTVTVREAIEASMNVCAVKTLADITPQAGFNYLLSFGFTTLVDGNDPDYPGFSDIQLPTALGGITKGVYNLEMTAAYAALANNGVYVEPIFYTKILDHDGNVLLDNSPDTHQVVQESTAALLTQGMTSVIDGSNGTGGKAALDNMPVSGKTGTTSDNVDIWFSAYTPFYTCSVWGGYDSNKPLDSGGTSWHLSLWKAIMDRVHSGADYTEFPIPASIEQKTICTTTGLLAGPYCPSITEYFATGTVPTETCTGRHGYTGSSNSSSGDDSSSNYDSNSGYDSGSDNSSTNDNTSTPSDTGDDGGNTTDTPAPPTDDGGGDGGTTE